MNKDDESEDLGDSKNQKESFKNARNDNILSTPCTQTMFVHVWKHFGNL